MATKQLTDFMAPFHTALWSFHCTYVILLNLLLLKKRLDTHLHKSEKCQSLIAFIMEILAVDEHCKLHYKEAKDNHI